MDLASAKMIGAGLATMGVLGAGIGIGVLFGNFVNAGIRNPAAAKTQTGNLFVGMALSEATAIFALGIAMLILFG
jgi:F-type H+-transporting ATPase subunit c